MIRATLLWPGTFTAIIRRARTCEEVDRAGRKPGNMYITGHILLGMIRLLTFAAI